MLFKTKKYLESYRDSLEHIPPIYKIEFNETEQEIGYASMAGEVLNHGVIETLKHFDEKWHNHPKKLGYMKTYIEDELGYRLMRIDIGDGLKSNANLYELMECVIA